VKFISSTIKRSIFNKIDSSLSTARLGQKMILMIHDLPEDMMLKVAEMIYKDLFFRDNIKLTLKIAKSVVDGWSQSSRIKAENNSWTAELNNLASYRNVDADQGKYNIIILFGTDKVTDSASLADFNEFSLKTIWDYEMTKSFSSWIEVLLQDLEIDLPDIDGFKRFDNILKPIIDHGKADLLSMSQWLENMDFSECNTYFDIIEKMLKNLKVFGLPRFDSYEYKKTGKRFANYISDSDEFFSYSKYIDNSHKDKAIKAIDSLIDSKEEDPIWKDLENKNVLGLYETGEELLLGMKSYINERSKEDRDKLLDSDFAFIFDKVLKYKKKTEKKSKASIKNLDGSPVEISLTAIWETISDLYRSKSIDNEELIVKIEIESEAFRHDIDSDDSDRSADSNESFAKDYLCVLLGGLDDTLKSQIEISLQESSLVTISSNLLNDDIKYSYRPNVEAQLSFAVKIYTDQSEKPFVRKYNWCLYEHHSYRLAAELLKKAYNIYRSNNQERNLPFFTLPYYDELISISSDEEFKRVFLHSLKDSGTDTEFMVNMLTPELKRHDYKIIKDYEDLGTKYWQFIQTASRHGLLSSLNSEKWDNFQKAYNDVLEMIYTDNNQLMLPIANFLIRAFMIIKENSNIKGLEWYASYYEEAAIISVLHPSLLEMLKSQIVYQCACFNYLVKQEFVKSTGQRQFKKQAWQSYLDLSAIRMPINCLLINKNKKVDTNVRGYDLIHKIGNQSEDCGYQSTRFNFLISDDYDETHTSITDSDISFETRQSKLLTNILFDYFQLHPHARDGISLAVYLNRDIQPIIAGINAYLHKISNENDKNNFAIDTNSRKIYNINLTLINDSFDDNNIRKWIDYWKAIWEEAETSNKFKVYRNCRFSVSHRLLSTIDKQSFLRIIDDDFYTDIMFLYSFSDANSTSDLFAADEFDKTEYSLRYPILERSVPSTKEYFGSLERKKNISNRQFKNSSSFSSYIRALKINTAVSDTITKTIIDFQIWVDILEVIHKKSEWVVCIDPNIDDILIRKRNSPDTSKREIIGFGSGVGASGEENFTISSEKSSFSEITHSLKSAIKSLITDEAWSGDDYCKISKGVINEAECLSGLSVVRATGVNDEYIRDFMSYSLTRKLLTESSDILCDTMVSLDAYIHWFDFADNSKRPDLLWLRARLNKENIIEVYMHVIECKMSKGVDYLIPAAKTQIENGVHVLRESFLPLSDESCKLDDDKPSRRYWWMQLHRLIATKSVVKICDLENIENALEKLANGNYKISWGASIFAFLIDESGEFPENKGSWDVSGLDRGKANIYHFAKDAIKNIATKNIQDLAYDEFLDEFRMIDFDEISAYVESSIDEDDFIEEYLPEGKIETDNDVIEDDYDAEEDEQDFAGWDLISDDYMKDINEKVCEEPISNTYHEAESSDPENDMTEPLIEEQEPVQETQNTSVPDRILIGKTDKGEEVYWEFGHEQLSNRHAVILGSSGMGKSYAIQCLLCELARKDQNNLIIDYTDGFIDSKIEPNAKKYIPQKAQTYIYEEPLQIDPFKVQVSYEGGREFRDDPLTIAKRVAAIFYKVYNLGSQQHPLVVNAIQDGIKKYGDDFSLDLFLEVIEEFIDSPHFTKNTISTTITKLSSFISSKPFSTSKEGVSWEHIFTDKVIKNKVFQFYRVDSQSRRAIVEFVLWDLYSYVSSQGNKDLPRVVVLDEIQNLDLGDDSPVAKYLTEGRKHGIALISATQSLKGVGGLNDSKVSRLFQSDLKLFFRPSDNELKEQAGILHNIMHDVSAKEWTSHLSKLKKGECYVIGSHLMKDQDELKQKVQKVKICSLEERGFDGSQNDK